MATKKTSPAENWQVEPAGSGRFNIVLPDGSCIATIGDGLHEGDPEQARTNAEFIVRACNAHDELIEALKLCSGYAGAGLIGNEAARKGKLQQIVDTAKNVLAKANVRAA